MDFTLSKYQHLLETCLKTNQQIITIHDFLKQGQPQENTIIMRHDVDRRITNTLKMARLEAKLGIKSTYYFRVPYTFKPSIIKEIAEMGHEVGFHYETLAKAKGDHAKAFELFKQELEQLRQVADIHTVCMHGSPLSSYDNRDLWKHYDLKTLDIIGEPYLSIDYSNIIYLTDTGRSWDSDKTNLKDRVSQSEAKHPPLKTTDDVIDFVSKNHKTIIIQTHPERWAYSIDSLAISYAMDLAANTIKRGLRILRSS